MMPYLVPTDFRYFYSATIYNVVDGDTVDAAIDLGFRIEWRQRWRLYGINTYEMNAADLRLRALAVEAKHTVEGLLGKQVIFRTHMDRADKYGRWLTIVHYQDIDGAWHVLNDELVAAGLATVYLL